MGAALQMSVGGSGSSVVRHCHYVLYSIHIDFDLSAKVPLLKLAIRYVKNSLLTAIGGVRTQKSHDLTHLLSTTHANRIILHCKDDDF